MSLRRSDVLGAAMEILDAYGLADLTMRRLAATLGVQPGALYWHFANKQTLLSAIADEILRELPTAPTGDWRAGIREWALRLHDLLRTRRSAAELVSGVLALRSWEDSPGRDVERWLVASGIAPRTARAAASGVLHLVLGHTADEEQADQLAELGVREEGVPHDSRDLLDDGVALLLAGVGATAPSSAPGAGSGGPPA
ncbi:MAG: TetR family transcriptional regulator [Propionibacteriaceae bacterium]|nr:TetR family transcriptional regulator [Propionibacteriaceae bacterium]